MKIIAFFKQKKEVELASIICGWMFLILTIFMTIPFLIDEKTSSNIVMFWNKIILEVLSFLGGN